MTPDLFRKLSALGLSHEQMAGVLEIFDEDAAARKAKVKARVDKWRSKNKSETLRNVTERSVTAPNVTEGLARVEDNYLPTEISGRKENKKAASLSDLAAFKADLEQDASAEQVESFAKHRKAKNGQNSAYSAKLFRRDADACGLSVSQAIDTAISRGWLTVKPEYLAGRQQSAPQPRAPPAEPDFNTILDAMQGKRHEPQHTGPTIEASYERGDRGSSADIVQFHALSARG